MDDLSKAATQAVFEEGYAAGKADAVEAHLEDMRRLLVRSEHVQDRLLVSVLAEIARSNAQHQGG